MSQDLDPEDLRDLVTEFFTAADSVIEQYGGTVDKHIGDAVMALFGAPVAHGDDALRAVRAALDIHREVEALGARAGRALTAHSSIACGEVMAGGLGRDGRAEYTVLGDAVNLAARLNDLAAANEIVIADAVSRSVGEVAECEALGEVSLKGLTRPVRAWRVRGLRAGVGTGATAAARAPFVGRQREMRQLSGMLDACIEGQSGQVALLRGEAGIGKSRLLDEVWALAEARGFTAHRGLVLNFGVGKGRDAIRAIVRSVLGLSLSADEAKRAAALEATMEAGRLDAARRVFLNDLLDLPQPRDLRAQYEAMDNAARNRGKQRVSAELIRAAAEAGPVYLAIEDIHWAPPVTLAHLAAIARAMEDGPMVLIMTTRVEGDPIDSAWRAAAGGCSLVTVDLGPLREAEALLLAGRFVDATDRLARRCIERAEGNPLFLEQLLRNAEESEDSAVPGTIQSLVLARMDRLPTADKEALQAASVIGQRFDLVALRHLSEKPDYDCGVLIDHVLARQEGDEFLFAHALIREGVYASLLKSRRRALHLRLAAWFAERDPVLHAEHLDRAEDPGAAWAYLGAAESQAANYRYEHALALIERGLALADRRAHRFILTYTKGRILHDLGTISESNTAYEAALELADDDAGRCRAWIGLAAGMRITDDFDGAFAALEKAEVAARAEDLTEELARIHHLRGNLNFPLGRIEACLEDHRKSLEFARRAGSPEQEAEALGGMGDAEYARGRMVEGEKYFRRCVALCRDHGFGWIEAANQSMVGHLQLYLDGPAAAVEAASAAAATARAVGHLRAELNCTLSQFFSLIELGSCDEADALFARAEVLIERLGARRFRSTVLAWRARGLLIRGRRDEALKLARAAYEMTRAVGFGFDGPRVLSVVALASEDRNARRAALDEGEALIRRGTVAHNQFHFYRDAMEIVLAEQNWPAVERYAEALETFARPEPLPWSTFFVARARALAARGRGQRDGALAGELERLRAEAARRGFITSIPAIERALGVTEA